MAMNFQKLEKIVDDSKVSNFSAAEPSALQQMITYYNDYASVLRHLYDRTEEASTLVGEKNWDLQTLSRYAENPNKENAGKLAKKYIKNASKAIDVFDDYGSDMTYIDKNGRLKMAATVQFFVNNRRYWRQKRMASTLKTVTEADQGVGIDYAVPSPPATKAQKLLHFDDCIKYANKIKLLSAATEIYANIEDLKQLRDRKIAKNTSADSDIKMNEDGTIPEGQRIYSYGKNQQFVSSDGIADALQSAQQDIDAYEAAKKSKKKGPELQEAKKKASEAEKKKKHLEHIQAEDKLDQQIKASPLTIINQNALLGYMAFDPGNYVEHIKKLAAQANDPNASKRAKKRARSELTKHADIHFQLTDSEGEKSTERAAKYFGDDEAEGTSEIHKGRDIAKEGGKLAFENADTILDMAANKAVPQLTKWFGHGDVAETFGNTDDLLEGFDKVREKTPDFNADNMTGSDSYTFKSDKDLITGKQETTTTTRKDLETGLKYDGSIGIVGGLIGLISSFKDFYDLYKSAKEIIEKGDKGDTSQIVEDVLAFYLDIANTLISLTDTIAGLISSGFKLAASTGAALLETAASACGALGTISNGLGVAAAAVETLKGVVDIVRHSRAAHRAGKAKKDVKDLAANEADKNKQARILRNAMFLQRARSASERQASLAAVDTVSGAINVASAAMVFVPGAGLIGTGLGLLASGASMLAKAIINSKFKDKNAKEGFAASIGMTMKDYNELTKKMGHKSAERTHEVMRRNLGISTRDDYSKALAITNAVDLYAGAQAYNFINKDPKNPKDSTQKAIKRSMEGIGFTVPAAYPKIELSDILDKVEAPKDWRGQLRTAISNNTDFTIKEDRSASMAKEIVGGKFDAKPVTRPRANAMIGQERPNLSPPPSSPVVEDLSGSPSASSSAIDSRKTRSRRNTI